MAETINELLSQLLATPEADSFGLEFELELAGQLPPLSRTINSLARIQFAEFITRFNQRYAAWLIDPDAGGISAPPIFKDYTRWLKLLPDPATEGASREFRDAINNDPFFERFWSGYYYDFPHFLPPFFEGDDYYWDHAALRFDFAGAYHQNPNYFRIIVGGSLVFGFTVPLAIWAHAQIFTTHSISECDAQAATQLAANREFIERQARLEGRLTAEHVKELEIMSKAALASAHECKTKLDRIKVKMSLNPGPEFEVRINDHEEPDETPKPE